MEQTEVRSELLRNLRKDVIGPGWDKNGSPCLDERLDISGLPDRYYLTGFLAPVKNEGGRTHVSENVLPTKEDSADIDVGGGGGAFDMPSSFVAGTFLQPSSMGLTVCPDHTSGEGWSVGIALTWGRYQRQSNGSWRRRHHSDSITLSSDDLPYGGTQNIVLQEQLMMHIRRGGEDHPTVTVRVVNDIDILEGVSRTECTIFQPTIELRSESGWLDVRKSDPIREDKVMAILYSESRVLALGHNVGVDWDESSIRTDFMPEFEMRTMRLTEELDDIVPGMVGLCSEDDGEVGESISSLQLLVERYRDWINRGEVELGGRFESGSIPERLKDESARMLSDARENARRMEEGIKFLLRNEEVRHAFVLANRSIRMSQDEPGHPDISERTRGDGSLINFKWRPFQIAFQLLNIKSVCALEEEDEGREERDLVDLAWFPTGGGKTEAYLGLIATLGFYRRIRFPEKEERPSVHVIMRYTLRLLTSDQADRLVRLIGAMNFVAREDHPDHPFTDFRVGMWVGRDQSPNDLQINDSRKEWGTSDPISSAEGNLVKLLNDNAEKRGTVIQFEVCPWCGEGRSPKEWAGNWEVTTPPGSTLPTLQGRCPNQECRFHEGIPFSCIDDDLYMRPPTILLGTADKFVQLSKNPWARSVDNDATSPIARKFNARTMLAFHGSGEAKDPRPPDLVIQDELHLLTGPLGTLAGLVETAIDTVWSEKGHKPKYIAATATIRGADRDVMLMYGRGLNIFPPPVSDAADNFFARLEEEAGKGRLHTAIMGPADRSRTLLNQPAGSLLQRIHQIREDNPGVSDAIFDPYYTLVGYFNSLRELGGAQTAIPNQIAVEMMGRFSADWNGGQKRDLRQSMELTSRKTSAELKTVKAALNRRLGDPQGHVDTVVTTNMFQVGIDIPRLGLMAIVGQPRSNSEYIQSSGRIGRRTPGLVLSLLRSTYPRDQSHYENFRAFHQEVYRNVDLTSTTPFAGGSLDRGMETAVAVMFRMHTDKLAGRMDLAALSRSAALANECRDLMSSFLDKIRTREGEPDVNTPSALIDEAVRFAKRTWTNLRLFSKQCEANGYEAAWEVFREEEHARGRRGWLQNDLMPGFSKKTAMQSLRDVAPEVRIQEERKGAQVEGLPEGHLFSQAAPGSLWQKQGWTYLTLGVNRWDNGWGNLALNPENDGTRPGQMIGMPNVTNMLGMPELKLRYLPKQDFHGAVRYRKFPGKYGYRCENGHLENYLSENEDGGAECPRCGGQSLPTRFVSICRNGHMANFDYWGWVHNDSSKRGACSRDSKLNLNYGDDSSFTLKDWLVECTSCDAPQRSMEEVPWITEESGPECVGWVPWLDGDIEERCEATGPDGEVVKNRMIHAQVGATNASFQNGGSILLIPLGVRWSLSENGDIHALCSVTENGRDTFDTVAGSIGDRLVQPLSGTAYLTDDGEIDWDLLFDACNKYRELFMGAAQLTVGTVRDRERIGFVDSRPDRQYDAEEFDCRPVVSGSLVGRWDDPDWPIRQVSRADRFRELRYITGLNRAYPRGDPNEGKQQPIDLGSVEGRRYGIARLHHGEGLYFDLKPKWVESIARARGSTMSDSHSSMSACVDSLRVDTREQLPTVEFEGEGGNRLTVVHTLSHLLIREICSLSGYSLGSIRERLYLEENEEGGVRCAGIFLYTSGPSSDGTLGGLVRQGTPELTENLIERAVAAVELCSNDPVCMDHIPSANERNGAACHSCLYLPETSCELGNLFLDRRWG